MIPQNIWLVPARIFRIALEQYEWFDSFIGVD